MVRPRIQAPYICSRCMRKPIRTFSTALPLRSTQYTPLPSRTIVSVTGEAAPKFLQGLTTNNIDPARTTGWYTAFLNAQGRVLYDAFIYPFFGGETAGEVAYLIEVDRGEAKGFMQHLKRHKLRTKIKIQDLSGEMDVYAAWDTTSTLAPPTPTKSQQTITLADPRLPNFGTRTIHTAGLPLPPHLSDLPEAKPEAYTLHRYANGIPEGPSEILPGASLPQESNMDHLNGIDFRKGCYLGQELTIRTQHTGVIRKRILPVQLYTDSAAPPPASLTYDAATASVPLPLPQSGAEIKAAGAKRGCGKFLAGMGNVGLALCRLESMTDLRVSAEGGPYQEGMEFLIGGIKVKAFVPAWLREAEKKKAEKWRGPLD